MTTKKMTRKTRVLESQRRTYKNKTYVRMAMYPKTRDAIRRKSTKANETMMDWLDKEVEKL